MMSNRQSFNQNGGASDQLGKLHNQKGNHQHIEKHGWPTKASKAS